MIGVEGAICSDDLRCGSLLLTQFCQDMNTMCAPNKRQHTAWCVGCEPMKRGKHRVLNDIQTLPLGHTFYLS